jgi:hypothetical protein
MFQDVTIPPSGADLSFELFIGNRHSAFITPSTLSHVGGDNQQFRMDIMDPAAALRDVGSGVLQAVYQTEVGDPLVSGYTTITAPLEFGGQTVRLRFTEVDNQWFFQAGIDNVTVIPRNDPPEFVFPTPADETEFSVIANHEITIGVQATDPDAGQTVTLGATMDPLPFTGFSFTETTVVDETTTGAFSWNPTVDDHFLGPPTLQTYTVVFTAEDNLGSSAEPVSVTIEVLPDPCEDVVDDCNAEIVIPGEPKTVELEVGQTIVASYDVLFGKYTVSVVISTQLLAGPGTPAGPSSGSFGTAAAVFGSGPFGPAPAVFDIGCHHEFLLFQDGNCLNVVVENADGSGAPGPDRRTDDPVIVALCRSHDALPDGDPSSERLMFRYNSPTGDVVALENVPADVDCGGLAPPPSPSSNGFINLASRLLNRARQWLAPRLAFAAVVWEHRGLGGRTRTSDNFTAVWADPSIEIREATVFPDDNDELVVKGTLLDFSGFDGAVDVRVTIADPAGGERGFGQTIAAEEFKKVRRLDLFQFRAKGNVIGIKEMNIHANGNFEVNLVKVDPSVDVSEPTNRFMSFTVRIGNGTVLHGTGIDFVEVLDPDTNLPTGEGVFVPGS